MKKSTYQNQLEAFIENVENEIKHFEHAIANADVEAKLFIEGKKNFQKRLKLAKKQLIEGKSRLSQEVNPDKKIKPKKIKP